MSRALDAVILALDPGTYATGHVTIVGGEIVGFGIQENDALVGKIAAYAPRAGDVLVVEMIASYGMAVGRDVFETCVWIGRFVQAWRGTSARVYRREVKQHLCASARGKDANVRQAIIDLYGGRGAAIGTKYAPGPLHGISSHVWSALAVAITYLDTQVDGHGQK